MASAGDIEAGAAFVRAYLNDKEVTAGLARLNQSLQKFSRDAARASQTMMQRFAAAAKKAVASAGQSMSLLGGQLMRAGVVGLAPAIFGVKQFAEFDKQMRNVSTMLSEPEQHMGKFTAGIKKLSVEFGEGTDALSSGLYDILSASIAPQHALSVLDTAVRSAKGGMTDTATATKVLVNVLNAFQKDASQSADVADMLFMTVRRGVLTFPELAEHLGMVTASANAAGLSMEEMGASIATMTRGGLKADMAITGMANILKQFLAPTAEGEAIAKKYGTELSVAAIKAEGFLGVMEKLARATPEEFAKLFPDIRGMRGALALRSDIAGLAEDMGFMASKTGAAGAAFDKMAGGPATAINKIWQSIKQMAVAIGEELAPAIERISKWLQEVVGPVSAWVKANGQLIVTVAKLALGTLALGAALKVAGGAMTLLAAHPVIAGLAALAVVLIAVEYAANRSTAAAIKMRLAAEDQLQAGDRKRAAAIAEMRELEELAKKTELNSTQQARAETLIANLTGAYGELGAKVDKTTGKIVGLTKAQAKLNQRMQEAAELEAKAVLVGVEAELNEWLKKREKMGISGVTGGFELAAALVTGGPKAVFRTIREAGEAVDVKGGIIEARLTAASARLYAIQSGAAGALTGEDESPEAKARAEAEAIAGTEAAERDAQHRINMIRLKWIEDRFDRERAMILERYAFEIEQAKAAGKSIAQIEEARELELAQLEEERARDKADERRKRMEEEAKAEFDLLSDIRRLEVEASGLPSYEKRKRLLDIEQEEERAAGILAGLDVDLLARKQELERLALDAELRGQRFTAAGTFDPFAAARMGGGGPMDKIAKSTEETAKNTKQIARNLPLTLGA